MRRTATFLLVLPLLALSACSSGPAKGNDPTATAGPAKPSAAASASTTATVAQKYVDAVAANDLAAIGGLFAPDIVWHQPGHNRYSGTRRGGAAINEMIGAQMAATKGTFKLEVTGAAMVNDALAAIPVRFSGKRDAAELSMKGVDVLRIAGDRIAEVWLFSADQKTEDTFWGTDDTTPPAATDPSTTATVATRYVDAVTANDAAAIGSLFATDIVWHQPGTNRHSGTRRGGDAVNQLIGDQMTATKGTLKVKATATPMINGDVAAVPVHFSATRDGKNLSMDGVDILRVDGNHITEAWLFSADQQAEDAFWDAP